MTGGPAGAGTRRAGLVALLAAALLAAALCGCAQNDPPKVEDNVYPKDYRPGLVRLLRLKVDDPNAIREAYVAEPVLRTVPSGSTRYIACIRFNAKGKDGQYEGAKEFAAYFFSGEITQIVDAGRELCGNAAYQPFPELDKYCREQGCKQS